MTNKFVWDIDDVEMQSSNNVKKLIKVLKAWPTREERLRKGLSSAAPVATPNADVKIIKPDDETGMDHLKRQQQARKLKKAAMRKERRRKLRELQQERSNVPEAKL